MTSVGLGLLTQGSPARIWTQLRQLYNGSSGYPKYGEMNWVRNARAKGSVTLARGKRSETLSIAPVSAEKGASVLKEYLTLERISRPYFDAGPDAPLEAFIAEMLRHPVFILSPTSA